MQINMKITVPKDEWVEITGGEALVNMFAFWIKWAVVLWFSSYILAYVWGKVFLDFAPDICQILK